VHVAIDDATALTYVEVAADEQKRRPWNSCPSASLVSEQGIHLVRWILQNNGPLLPIWELAEKPVAPWNLKPIAPSPTRPDQRRRAERFHQNPSAEGLRIALTQTSMNQPDGTPYLGSITAAGAHMAPRCLTPQQCLHAADR